MKIYLVRHGETNLNKNRILQGRFDTSLNKEGIEVASITGSKLIDVNFDYAYSSPLKRSIQTIETILNKSNNNIPIILDERLQEVSLGDWTLTSIDDKNNPYYQDIKTFFKDPFALSSIPNGENVYDVMKRSQDFLKELIQKNDDKTYLIGTHGFALRSMLNFLYKDKTNFWQDQVPFNCSITILEAKDGNIKIIKDNICLYDNKKDYYK